MPDEAAPRPPDAACDVWLEVAGTGRTLGIEQSDEVSHEAGDRSHQEGYLWRLWAPAEVPSEIDAALRQMLGRLSLADLRERLETLEDAKAAIVIGVFMGTDLSGFDLNPETLALIEQSGLQLSLTIYP